MKQLTLEDVVGSFDYAAKSTAEKFLQHNVITYEVHFYDPDERQKIDWFDVKTENEAWSAAVKEHGKSIQKIRVTISDRTRDEIMALD
ncbi:MULTISPECIES: hypothetical protein [Bacillus]|uniref:Uncharacterized protein n=2 Tax=Bacillus cereus group TaxID=86661 RepID=A0A2C1DWB0_BACCE|nr:MULTISPECIES: hypothetical protein [Bacillus cereus group]OFD70489.1 hypothetical protein BWGOE8_55830 [Bacillus mycoides]OFD71589.1 hypothetical protein BWGOE10_56620 [Bacillus mycoides]OFD74603.1 hypothetical protein BWGOE9_38270 [Bacillus mycoides]PGT04707.1 hypothetical protein COD09_06935 [Bacillus cereus]